MLNNIHQQFINNVKKGRGERLKITEDVFSGRIWTGEQALEQGLIDGLSSPGRVAREVIGEDNLVDYTYKKPLWQNFAKKIGAQLTQGIWSQLNFVVR